MNVQKYQKGARRPSNAGITMVELVGALAILFVLVAAFLPAVQRSREAANQAANQADLQRIGAALDTYHKGKGSFPTTLADIVPASRNGYRFVGDVVTAHHVRLIAEPVAGVTASMTGILDVQGSTPVTGAAPTRTIATIRYVATPGAAVARANMFAGLWEEAVRGFADILGRQSADVQTEALVELRRMLGASGGTQSSFDALKSNNSMLSFQSIHAAIGACDGSVRPGSFGECDGSVRTCDGSVRPGQISTCDGSVRTAFTALWGAIAFNMQLGALGENWMALPGLASPPAMPPGNVFNVTELTALTNTLVVDPTLQGALIGLLRTAFAAESAGNTPALDQALKSYVTLLQGQVATYASGAPTVGYLNAQGLIDFAKAIE
jgi:type II secretory pathway pseudopilin PulG